MDQSTIRCQLSPLKPSPSPPFSISTLRDIPSPPPLNLPHISYEQHDVTLENNHPSSPTSHLRRSTFRGGAAAPGATLAWQTRRDSSFATVLFWWRHGANAPSVGSSGGKLFLQSVLSCRPEFSWREGVGSGLMGYGRSVGRGCGEALWGREQRPEVSHFPVQSCGTRLRAEGRSFDVSGEQEGLMWRSPEWMGLGGLTVSAHEFKSKGSGRRRAYWSRHGEECNQPVRSCEGTAASHGTNGDYTNCQAPHKDHQTYFISSLHSETKRVLMETLASDQSC